MAKTPKKILALCQKITAKRPKTVIDHIIKHGHITTEELTKRYGYGHPPRAARDVREHGVPIETFRVTGSDGREIAAYRFGKLRRGRLRRLEGRTGLSKVIKEALIKKYGCRCFIYLEEMSAADLQIDHRVPYEVAGDGGEIELKADDFMLLCGSANRAKDWSCQHCENWRNFKKPEICLTCYWAYPEHYKHIAMRQVRRLDLIWQGDEIANYERLRKKARDLAIEIPAYVKKIINAAQKRPTS
jgi:hypothetical protein